MWLDVSNFITALMWNLWLKLTTPRVYTSMIFNTLRLTLVETKENNKRLHQLHNIQPKKNNEQHDYEILTLLRPQKHYSTALSKKKKKGNGYITQ